MVGRLDVPLGLGARLEQGACDARIASSSTRASSRLISPSATPSDAGPRAPPPPPLRALALAPLSLLCLGTRASRPLVRLAHRRGARLVRLFETSSQAERPAVAASVRAASTSQLDRSRPAAAARASAAGGAPLVDLRTQRLRCLIELALHPPLPHLRRPALAAS